MQLVINGEPEEFDEPASMGDLLASLRLARQRVAIEVNGELVPRDAYDATTLHEGDRIEIVTFVGGG